MIDKPVRCPLCPRRFGDESALQAHTTAKHPNGHVGKLPTDSRPTMTEIEPRCIECGKLAAFVTGEAIYPHRRDLWGKNFYRCECGAYCGTHPNTFVPLGYPCGPETRKARMAAHAAFDPLWRNKQMKRNEAYKWLAGATGIEREKCHIGMMTIEQARSVVEAVRSRVRCACGGNPHTVTCPMKPEKPL